MASISLENISSLIGKPVKDELNREIGKVLSFIIDSNGQVSDVLIRGNNTEYQCHPVDRLIVDDDAITLLSEINRTVKMVSEEIPLLWRKKKVLDKLLDENKILPEIYENLQREFGESLEKLKTNAQGVLDEMDGQISECEEIFKTLHFAKTYLEIEHEIGHVEEEAYRESLYSILNGLKDLVEKKEGLQERRESLSNILLGEESRSEIHQPEKEEIEETQELEVIEGQEDVTEKPLESQPVITVHMK